MKTVIHPTQLTETEWTRIEIPDIPVVEASRNKTHGLYWEYRKQIDNCRKWINTFGKKYEHHFTTQVDVIIEALVDVRPVKKTGVYQRGRNKGKPWSRMITPSLIDAPNVDDKIYTDLLQRYTTMKVGGKLTKVENPIWWIEDDTPEYLRWVCKRVLPANGNKITITIVSTGTSTGD